MHVSGLTKAQATVIQLPASLTAILVRTVGNKPYVKEGKCEETKEGKKWSSEERRKGEGERAATVLETWTPLSSDI